MPSKIHQASFFWKNDQPGGLGFTLGPPSFSPDELTDMFTGRGVKRYFADSDMALGTGVAQTYLAQLEEIAKVKETATMQQVLLAALNIMWLADRGFIPNDEFNGPQFLKIGSPK